MTVWVLNQALTPEEEARITERTHLVLPFSEFPDFSMAKNEAEYKRLLQALHPDAPPETLVRLLEKSWRLQGAIHQEDIIAVPLSTQHELVLAEVIGAYRYHAEGAADVHTVPVKWHEKRVPMRALAKHKELFDGGALREVTNAEARTVIRDRLPHSYNRFAAWKWLLVVFLIWRLIMFAMRHNMGANGF